jgi:hypothetical protein
MYLPTYLHTYLPTYIHTYIHTYVNLGETKAEQKLNITDQGSKSASAKLRNYSSLIFELTISIKNVSDSTQQNK